MTQGQKIDCAIVVAVAVLVLLVALTAKSVTIPVVTMRAPDGSNLNGRIEFSLPKQSINTCSGGVIVPRRVGTLQVVNGSSTGAPTLAESDCLSPEQPYIVSIYSGNTLVQQTRWWVGYVSGVKFTPSSGGTFLAPTGVTGSVFSELAVYTMPQGAYKFVTAAITVTASSVTQTTFTWPTPFPDTNYAVACTRNNHNVTIDFANQTQNTVTVYTENQVASDQNVTINCNARTNYPATITPSNALLKSANLSTSPWLSSNSGAAAPTVTANAGTAPDGTNTATQLAFPATTSGQWSLRGQQITALTITSPLTQPFAMSVWLKAASPCTVLLWIDTGGGFTAVQTPVSVTSTWQRFWTSGFYPSNTTVGANPEPFIGLTGTRSACTVLAWGAQFEPEIQATSYVATN